MHYLLPVVLSLSLELFSLGIALQYYTGEDDCQADCGSWIRWLVSRIRSCADNLGGGWGKDEVQRTAKGYGDIGHGKDVGLRLLLLAAVNMAARALPLQTNRRQITKKRGPGRNTRSSASCDDAELHCVPSTYYLKFCAGHSVCFVFLCSA